MDELYQKLLASGISEEQLEQELERRTKEFGGFMTKQGVLFIIAKEHGINPYSDTAYKELDQMIDYDEFSITVSEVKEQMTNIVLLGKIISFTTPREFARKDSSIGTVSSFILGDWTGSIKIVLWGDNAQLVESEFFKHEEIVRVIGGYSKVDTEDTIEVHLSKSGRLIIAPTDVKKALREQLESVSESEVYVTPNSSKLGLMDLVDQYSFIKRVQGEVEITQFKELIKKDGERTFILRLLLSDSTGSIPVIIWGMNAVESLKLLEDGCKVQLTNLSVKENSFTSARELFFTKKSTLKIL
jgi:ssDNA-binding replication factor A large subunit